MKISVAMATYNGAKYLEDQLRSFLDQTRQPDELVVADDFSTDNTEEILSAFSKKAPFQVVSLRSQRNMGYCATFNTALLRTTGDIVFLSDQDDVWFPNKIEYIVKLADKNPHALVLMNDAALTDADLRDTGLTKIGQMRSVGLSTRGFAMGCCCAIRRELLDICMPIPGAFGAHDMWLVEFADRLNRKLVDVTTLQYYRRHGSNASDIILNRTERLTRWDLFLHRTERLREGRETFADELKRDKLLLAGIERAVSLSDGATKEKLLSLLDYYQLKVDANNKRIAMRRLGFFPRLICSVVFLSRGGYQGSRIFRSIAKDILGI